MFGCYGMYGRIVLVLCCFYYLVVEVCVVWVGIYDCDVDVVWCEFCVYCFGY